jgi:hypothetical protein
MAPPPEFTAPSTRIDPATGERVMAGGDALPALLDTLDVGGTIRSQLIRLQAWVKQTAGEHSD